MSRSPSEVRREIEETRREIEDVRRDMSETIEALADRTSPRRIAERRRSRVAAHPVPSVLLAVASLALVVALVGRRRRRR
jgi:Protein of unknown function (DUF3618)